MGEPFVLVVEDDPIVRMVTCKQVLQLGFKCEAVESAEEAIGLDFSNVALILMDIGLPGIDGITATTMIRESELQQARRRIPIIALTAHSQRESCLAAGMDDFVQKPALLADIKSVLDRWLPAKEL